MNGYVRPNLLSTRSVLRVLVAHFNEVTALPLSPSHSATPLPSCAPSLSTTIQVQCSASGSGLLRHGESRRGGRVRGRRWRIGRRGRAFRDRRRALSLLLLLALLVLAHALAARAALKEGCRLTDVRVGQTRADVRVVPCLLLALRLGERVELLLLHRVLEVADAVAALLVVVDGRVRGGAAVSGGEADAHRLERAAQLLVAVPVLDVALDLDVRYQAERRVLRGEHLGQLPALGDAMARGSGHDGARVIVLVQEHIAYGWLGVLLAADVALERQRHRPAVPRLSQKHGEALVVNCGHLRTVGMCGCRIWLAVSETTTRNIAADHCCRNFSVSIIRPACVHRATHA